MKFMSQVPELKMLPLICYQDVYEEEDNKIKEQDTESGEMDFKNKLKRFNGKGRLKRKKIKPRKDDTVEAPKCKKQKSLCATQGDEVFFYF